MCVSAFDAINFVPTVVDMQSLVEVSSQSDCVLCKHRNVIKTDRSGFLISCFGWLGECWRNQEKLQCGWVFIFIMCTIWCTLKCIHAVSSVDLRSTLQASDGKWKFMTLCMANAFSFFAITSLYDGSRFSTVRQQHHQPIEREIKNLLLFKREKKK